MIHPVVSYCSDIMPGWAICEIRLVNVDNIASVRDFWDSLPDEVWMNIDIERSWGTAISGIEILKRNAVFCVEIWRWPNQIDKEGCDGFNPYSIVDRTRDRHCGNTEAC